jgi:hypothetical protein
MLSLNSIYNNQFITEFDFILYCMKVFFDYSLSLYFLINTFELLVIIYNSINAAKKFMDNSKFICPAFLFLRCEELHIFSQFFKMSIGFINVVAIVYFVLIASSYFGKNVNSSTVTTPNWHTRGDMVMCIDKLSNGENRSTLRERKFVHFVFIGDSRIRQHFLNFFKVNTCKVAY